VALAEATAARVADEMMAEAIPKNQRRVDDVSGCYIIKPNNTLL